MYLLFRYHNITPRQYKDMGEGEKKIVRSFIRYEAEKRNEAIERMDQEKQEGIWLENLQM